MEKLNEFYGPNAGYVVELYERFLEDPDSVDEKSRAIFKQWTPPLEIESPHERSPELNLSDYNRLPSEKVAAAINLAQSIRIYGHLSAQLDPLGTPPPGDPWHDPAFHGISDTDLRQLPGSIIGGPLAENADNAFAAIQALRGVYSSSLGYDYGHIQVPEERDWLRIAAECGNYRPPQYPFDSIQLLERLTQVEVFEQFLHRIFPGKTRFSIEGLDILVPMLDELISQSVKADICTILIGMAHRGRLNILAHILGKPYAQILAEFKDPISRNPVRDELGWTGDVKYHKGAEHPLEGDKIIQLVIAMPPNPSHLEHVDPVLVGMARAAGSKVNEPGEPEFFPSASLPVMIHGDASITGQGVVAETLNLSRLPGYSVGGAIHIIANNQLGYTTEPFDSRSTLYASDLAKGFEVPIIHANADDVTGCLEAIRTAFAYREKFKKDFLIDLIGYRRYGHNEGDEPSFTQPLMYQVIEKHPSIRAIWAEGLQEKGQINSQSVDEMVKLRMDELQEVLANLQPEEALLEPQLEAPPKGAAKRVDTSVSLESLQELNENLLQVPESFTLHHKIERAMKRRLEIFTNPDSPSIDWATAEELAFASILADGIPIRLTGEDVQRGTFSQRHAVFHDVNNGATFIPLQSLPQARASFEAINSPLSENATVAFEFGYNTRMPERLVVWEAQYGDFINTAQTMIDEFVVSARAKWEQTPSLVMLLPHGDEGQGPDHSSGRPERFLQLSADTNIRLANCTTAAQYFHLLRRQALLLKTDPLPLIILTPKSLLRNPLVASAPRLLAEGHWQAVIDDSLDQEKRARINRLILCSGKIYIDLVSNASRELQKEVAIVRIEQLYPFPQDDLLAVLNSYTNLQEIVWIQEEPQNMGAWGFIEPHLHRLIQDRWPLHYIGRPQSASPAEGSSSLHTAHQKEIIKKAFETEWTHVKEGK
jgi:2-oxoglutarate dehydrogenase E1 component